MKEKDCEKPQVPSSEAQRKKLQEFFQGVTLTPNERRSFIEKLESKGIRFHHNGAERPYHDRIIGVTQTGEGCQLIKLRVFERKFEFPEIRILNLDKQKDVKECNNPINCLGSGTYGNVSVVRIKDQLYASKFIENHLARYYGNFKKVLRELCVLKLASALGVGVPIPEDMAYDMICYNNGIEILMELCRDAKAFFGNKFERSNMLMVRFNELKQQLKRKLRILHEFDTSHIDIKPENIVCSLDGQELYLSDFGISRIKAEDLYMKSSIRPDGSLFYAGKEMKKELDLNNIGKVPIDLCHNDVECLEKTFSVLELQMTKQYKWRQFELSNHPSRNEWKEGYFEFNKSINAEGKLDLLLRITDHKPQLRGFLSSLGLSEEQKRQQLININVRTIKKAQKFATNDQQYRIGLQQLYFTNERISILNGQKKYSGGWLLERALIFFYRCLYYPQQRQHCTEMIEFIQKQADNTCDNQDYDSLLTLCRDLLALATGSSKDLQPLMLDKYRHNPFALVQLMLVHYRKGAIDEVCQMAKELQAQNTEYFQVCHKMYIDALAKVDREAALKFAEEQYNNYNIVEIASKDIEGHRKWITDNYHTDKLCFQCRAKCQLKYNCLKLTAETNPEKAIAELKELMEEIKRKPAMNYTSQIMASLYSQYFWPLLIRVQARAEQNLGRISKSLMLLEEAELFSKEQIPWNILPSVEYMEQRGILLGQQKTTWKDGIELLLKTARIYKRHQGDRSLNLARTYINLAKTFFSNQKYKKGMSFLSMSENINIQVNKKRNDRYSDIDMTMRNNISILFERQRIAHQPKLVPKNVEWSSDSFANSVKSLVQELQNRLLFQPKKRLLAEFLCYNLLTCYDAHLSGKPREKRLRMCLNLLKYCKELRVRFDRLTDTNISYLFRDALKDQKDEDVKINIFQTAFEDRFTAIQPISEKKVEGIQELRQKTARKKFTREKAVIERWINGGAYNSKKQIESWQ